MLENAPFTPPPESDEAVTIELPSRGFGYKGAFPGGKVTIEPMTTADEKRLISSSRSIESIFALVKSRVSGLPIPFEQLYMEDVLYAFLMIRRLTYGPDYTLELKCEECGTRSQVVVRIPDDMAFTILEESDDIDTFDLFLTRAKVTVTLRRLTVGMNNSIARLIASRSRKRNLTHSPQQDHAMYAAAARISAIDGQPVNLTTSLPFYESLSGGDGSLIRDLFDKKAFGTSLLIDVTCPACDHVNELRMSYDANFFRDCSADRRPQRDSEGPTVLEPDLGDESL